MECRETCTIPRMLKHQNPWLYSVLHLHFSSIPLAGKGLDSGMGPWWQQLELAQAAAAPGD